MLYEVRNVELQFLCICLAVNWIKAAFFFCVFYILRKLLFYYLLIIQ